ncbi:TPA: AlpA family phage regulatory protein [Legionella pneumophila]|nr:AlpA family phage regulatory protein [Legionella pneumophila]HAU1943864.1 AlpA family phage regulatory protein [Legionella pneumophila]HCX3250677.1 AlpA family phage regulatory protein [Legionella pneumophila]
MKKSQFKQQLLFTKDVEQITGFNRVTLRRWWREGHFPAPVKLNGSVLAWHYDDIHQWIDDITKRATNPFMTFIEK